MISLPENHSIVDNNKLVYYSSIHTVQVINFPILGKLLIDPRIIHNLLGYWF